MRRIVLVALLCILPHVAWGGPGDVYIDAGGPHVDVERVKPPSGSSQCRQTYKDEPAKIEACQTANKAARRAADAYAGSRGLEDGFLRGYAFGLYRGIERGQKSAEVATKAKQDAESSPHIAGALDEVRAKAKSTGATDGKAEAQKRFEEAFAQKGWPKTKLGSRIAVPDYEHPEDPYIKFYGEPPAIEKLLAEKAGEAVDVPGSANRKYFESKRYPVRMLYEAQGERAFAWQEALDTEAGWKAWKAEESDELTYHEQLTGEARLAFEETFHSAYPEQASFYYSNKFYRALDVGTEQGMKAGVAIGEALRRSETMRKHVNARYRETVPQAFEKTYEEAYREAFDAFVAQRKAGPILSYANVKVVGVTDDGILTPGEGLEVHLDVKNIGLKEGNVTIELQGSVGEAQPAFVTAPPFRDSSLSTKKIVSVDEALGVGQKAKLTAVIEDKKWTTEATIRQVVEVESVSVEEMDTLHGSGIAVAKLINPSTVSSPSKVKVMVLVDDDKRNEVNAPSIEAGGSAMVELPFDGVDPLAFISGSSLDAVLSRNDTRIHSGNTQFKDDDPDERILEYFDALVYGEGYVPEGTKAAEQITRAHDLVLVLARSEVDRWKKNWFKNPWKQTPRETLLGRLTEQFETAPSDAREPYHALLSDVCKEGDRLPKVRWRKRKFYSQMCSILQTDSPDVADEEIEQTAKDGPTPKATPPDA